MKKNIKDKNCISILFTFTSPCKGKMILSILCAIISVIGGFIPYLGVYQIINLFIMKSIDIKQLLVCVGICIGGYIINLVFYGISTVLSHISAYNILEGLRLQITHRLMCAPLGEVTSKSIGYLKNIILDKVEAVEKPLAHMIPEVISNLLLPITVFIYLFTIDWRMGLSAMVTLPFAAIPMAISMKTFNSQYASYMKASDYVNSVIVEYVEGIEVVKAFNQSTKSYEKFATAVKTFQDFTLSWFKSTWKTMNLILSILPTTLLGTLPVGLGLYYKHSLTPTELTMCLILALGIIAPLLKFTTFIVEIKSIQHSIQEASELLNLQELPNIVEGVELNNYDIKFNHVSFSYTEKADEKVLNDISLKMPQGSFSALVGPSGSGKSTVARLIARFWDVTGGEISIGGVNVKNIPLDQLSQLVSFVTQDNFLFNCSLMENIRLGNTEATDEEVLMAARAACCDEFISTLEKGYNTPAGEAGKRLSGGEKQRIAIARAILKNAPVVILDEATAFTDPQNEHKLQRSIEALTKDKTLLVIAHRLSTIQKADQIIVLEKGKVIGCATQKELINNCELYAKMWQAHIGAKKWSVSSKGMEVTTYV